MNNYFKTQTPTHVTITLLGKQFQIKCPPDKTAELEQSVEYLEQKIQEIRETSGILNTEGVAILAALNITHELLGLQRDNTEYLSSLTSRVNELQNKVSNSLKSSQ